jgi:response regulator RpfG family c-di-GMP phosphodiesterase
MPETEAPNPHILFVDDEENILKSVKRLFLDEPMEVFTALSGEEALGLLAKNRGVAVIVSDQRMPGMSGAEFLEKAKELVPDAVRIVLTGYADVKAAVDAINKGGAARYIGKPWNDEELVAVIRDAASRHALVQENRRLTEIVHRQNAELRRWNSQLEVMVQQQTMELSKKNEELKGFNDRLKSNFRDIIESLAGLLELRDESTLSHSRNVSEMSVLAAWAMGLPAAEVEQITVASLLHDIGKIGMSDLLLLKNPEKMTADERRDYMQHSVRGQSAIHQIEDLRPAGVLIRHHHEAYNGTGFPDGLKGGDIPVGSRIIAAANFFEMKFSRSSDPNALSLAMNALREQAGKTLDPEICHILEKPLREKFATAPSRTGAVEREIPLKDLSAGMIASRDIRSGTGVLLLKKGAVLDAKSIQAIKRYEQVDPGSSGVYVWLGK